MTTPDMLSINNVAAKLGLSVHQLRRWELMFGLEIKRGRGQQRQYRDEDLSVLERIKELVEQGWPTSQIRPQLEAEGLVSPKLIGVTPSPGNPEVLQESIIGLRNFTERRFIEISKQIDELRQLLISVTLKNELSADKASPWQPTASEFMPAPKIQPAQEITIGPQISIDPPNSNMYGNQNSGLIGRPQPGPGLQRPETRTSFEPAAGNEAVSRSMSALDSMFKEREGSEASPEATAGYAKNPVIPPPDLMGTANTAVNSTIPPVRHSTIPPLPPAAPSPVEVDVVAPPESSPENSTVTSTDSYGNVSEAAAPVENLHTDTISTPSIQSVTSLQSLSTAPTEPTESTEAASSAAQYTATAVDHAALDEAALTAPSSEDFKFTGSPSAFSVPPLPPNPFKTSTEGAEAAQANLRSLFSPAPPEPPLGLNSAFAPASFAPANIGMPTAAPSQEDTAEELSEAENLFDDERSQIEEQQAALEESNQPIQLTPGPQVNFGPNVSAPTPQATPQRVDDNFGLGEVTDQNYLTVLGRALDLIGWTDEQADSYSLKTFGVPHWDELGRSQAEKLVAHLIGLLKEQLG